MYKEIVHNHSDSLEKKKQQQIFIIYLRVFKNVKK